MTKTFCFFRHPHNNAYNMIFMGGMKGIKPLLGKYFIKKNCRGSFVKLSEDMFSFYSMNGIKIEIPGISEGDLFHNNKHVRKFICSDSIVERVNEGFKLYKYKCRDLGKSGHVLLNDEQFSYLKFTTVTIEPSKHVVWTSEDWDKKCQFVSSDPCFFHWGLDDYFGEYELAETIRNDMDDDKNYVKVTDETPAA